MPFITSRKDREVLLDLHIQPKASRPGIVGLHDNALKVAVSSPPVEGRANKEITAFLARILNLPKSAVEIVSGQQGRRKRLLARGISAVEARQLIAPLLKKDD